MFICNYFRNISTINIMGRGLEVPDFKEISTSQYLYFNTGWLTDKEMKVKVKEGNQQKIGDNCFITIIRADPEETTYIIHIPKMNRPTFSTFRL